MDRLMGNRCGSVWLVIRWRSIREPRRAAGDTVGKINGPSELIGSIVDPESRLGGDRAA